MRILEIETFGRGGLIHYTYNLACALAERGHEVTLLTTAAYELDDRSLPEGLQVTKEIARFTHSRQHKLAPRVLDRARSLEALFDAFAVAAFARRLRPDIIHFHSTSTSSIAFLGMLRTLGIPLVATTHVVTPHERIRWQEAIYRRIHGFGDLLIAHSDFDRERLVSEFAIDPESVVVIPHGEYGFFDMGLDTSDRESARQSFGFEPHHKVALFFGYIREYKGLDILLEAWPAVVEAVPDARLLVAGDPGRLSESQRHDLESWASHVGQDSESNLARHAQIDKFAGQ